MSSWFELNKNQDGNYTFALKGDNGEVLLTSKTYLSKGSAMNDITVVRTNCEYEDRYERQEANGQHFFILQDPKHTIIGTSQKYPSAQLLENAISQAKSQGTTREVKASA